MNNDPSPSVAGPSAVPTNNDSTSRRRRRSKKTPAQVRFEAQIKMKYDWARQLMLNLDLTVYAQLCALYYMDCSFLQLLLRGMAQFIILTPKPKHVRQPPQSSSWATILLVTNLICISLHLFLSPSKSSEEMRGYLHGGIIIDLVGQKAPSSRLKLVALDLVVLALQMIMFTILMDRERLAKIIAGYTKKSLNTPPTSQDHDAEERGVLRDIVANSEDIEMQALDPVGAVVNSNGQTPILEVDEAREELLAEPIDNDSDDTPLDMFWSGTAIIGDFNVLDTLRDHLGVSSHGSGTALQSRGMFADVGRRSNALAQSLRRGINSG